MIDSFKYILQSPYLGLIAILVLAYGVSVNLFEGMWKGQVKIVYSTEVEFNQVMGGLSTVTGVMAVILMVVGSNCMRTLSWRTCALITPVVLITGSLLFFGVMYYNNSLMPEGIKIVDAIAQGAVSRELVVFAVVLGLIINAFGKAVKYSLFDPTQEMAYIPLDPELKVKGKAAVDVIGGRGGKSAGAYIQMGLLTVFSGSALYQLVPFIAPIAMGFVFLWILSIFRLNNRFRKLTDKTDDAPSKEPAYAS
jgi:AAA family ATP:ADP antiporter